MGCPIFIMCNCSLENINIKTSIISDYILSQFLDVDLQLFSTFIQVKDKILLDSEQNQRLSISFRLHKTGLSWEVMHWHCVGQMACAVHSSLYSFCSSSWHENMVVISAGLFQSWRVHCRLPGCCIPLHCSEHIFMQIFLFIEFVGNFSTFSSFQSDAIEASHNKNIYHDRQDRTSICHLCSVLLSHVD